MMIFIKNLPDNLQNKISEILILAIVSIAILFFTSCNEEPTSLGYETDSLTFVAISSSESEIIDSVGTYYIPISNINQGIIFVGKANGSEAYPFFRYGKLDTLEGVELVSATLHLFKNRYIYGDSTAIQSFEIVDVFKAFAPGYTYDSVFSTGGQIFGNEVWGNYNENISFKDIAGEREDTIRIDLDTRLIQNWIDFSILEKDLDSADERRTYSYTIGLRPNDGSTVINSFLSEALGSDSRERPNPFIKLVYRRDGNLDTVDIRANVVGNFIKPLEYNGTDIVLQSNTSYMSKINFDLSDIPSNASIIRAQLRLYFEPDSSIAGNLGFDNSISAIADVEPGSSASQIFVQYTGVKAEESNYYTLNNIVTAVERWTNRNKGKGFITLLPFRSATESNIYKVLDRHYFYGADAPLDKRPRLTVFYGTRPEF